ncbi:MAG TPA: di-heme oxidoredictase family protein, partial [Candidatus Angelobacter sp.]|nr:di-heme oxidoredictase family protein [Candidatus Angelobacter sp.]
MAPRKSLRLIVLAVVLASACVVIGIAQASLDAPAAFATPDYNNQQGAVSNGMTDNTTFAADEAVFMEVDDISNGLGPVFNARSCSDCHNSPNVGSYSQVTELRVGHRDARGNFVSPTISINDGADSIAGRSLVNDRSICVQAAERVPSSETIHALRATTNTLGDGYVEAIDSNTLLAISLNQPRQSNGRIAGEFIQVPLSEAPGRLRAGRFGWKNQQASLLSFAADAYVNEQGVTSRLQPTDTTSVCKTTTDPEDHEGADGLADIDHFARFMRASQAPPRDESLANSPDAIAGAGLFHSIGCDICHVSSITTAPAGTSINGGTFTVPPALGGKVIHPYSDFLLHNIGTGDGIVQNGPPDTANKMRTAPLWGMRAKSRLMHDLLSFTRQEAIMRHGGEAAGVTNNYRALT